MEVCIVAPGTPIGGCDPPQPASIAAATLMLSAQRLKPEIIISPASWSLNAPTRGGTNG